MDKALILIEELSKLLEKETNVKALQEIYSRVYGLKYYAEDRLKNELRDLSERMDFFKNVNFYGELSFGKCGDHAYWKIVDNVLTVGGHGDMWEDVSAPWDTSKFHSVIILDGITSIGGEGFNNARLSHIIIPASVKTIKEGAFFDARIENLILPETLETIEDGILTGFSRVVDTLSLSVNIPHIMPYSLFNRDDIIANTVHLNGEMPKALAPLVESCLFDDPDRCKFFYPAEWDREGNSFYEKLATTVVDCYEKQEIGSFDSKEDYLNALKNALIPYEV